MNNSGQLVALGNELREQNKPLDALMHYAQALIVDPDSASAFNNYGNTLRELGQPVRALPFLQHSVLLDPSNATTGLNLSLAYLAAGNYEAGFPTYEARWGFEHLQNTLPKFPKPRWLGESLEGKTILVVGEQGHGDMIQFSRFTMDLKARGAKSIHFQVSDGLIPLFSGSHIFDTVTGFIDPTVDYDYWVPLMSIPGIIGTSLKNLPVLTRYIEPNATNVRSWREILGPKKKLLIGFSWSGRRDSWINQHKAMPLSDMLELIKNNPQYQWVSLQADATEEEDQLLADAGVSLYPGQVSSWADTAALMENLDVIVSIDTAVAHLGGALGRPTWIPLSWYACDWRWLTERANSPWYSSVRLFRQPKLGDWASVNEKIAQFLSWFKI